MSDINWIESDEVGWLRLVHTRGIGPRKAWQIYDGLRGAGLNIADIFKMNAFNFDKFTGISPSLKSRLEQSNPSAAQDRLSELHNNALRLLYPGSAAFSVPEIRGLPPTMALWGDPGLLGRSGLEVLMKSRDASESVLTSFLQNVAQGKIDRKCWCFCPFSRLDWELIESLLRLDCGMILGLASGISRRAVALAHETPAGRMAILAPEPPLRSRGAHFACVEAFYHLFTTFSHKIFLLTIREKGKTARRISRALEMGCEVTEFSPMKKAVGKARLLKPEESAEIGNVEPSDSFDEEDTRFISCL